MERKTIFALALFAGGERGLFSHFFGFYTLIFCLRFPRYLFFGDGIHFRSLSTCLLVCVSLPKKKFFGKESEREEGRKVLYNSSAG